MTDWFFGTMGYSYADWSGAFYPQHARPNTYLRHYSKIFNAVELDTTFYGTPTPARVLNWKNQTPEGFIFCPKTPRAITHQADLAGQAGDMNLFVESVQHFEQQLGPILVQFPPTFEAGQLDKLIQFFKRLAPGPRYAVEFRHASWADMGVFDWLQENRICWVSTEYLYLPNRLIRTSEEVYIRFIGRHGQFERKNRLQKNVGPLLEKWAAMLAAIQDTLPACYGFFNNDFSGHAPSTANAFKKLLGLEVVSPQIPKQGRLF